MRRTTLAAAMLLTLGVAASPSTAQEPFTWNEDRPDSDAPAGVAGAVLQDVGELRFTYRMLHQDLEGNRVGQDTIPADLLLGDFVVVPVGATRTVHELGLAYGLSDRATISLFVPLVLSDTDRLTDDFVMFNTESNGIGDARGSLLLGLYEQGAYRAHVSAGLSVPTGSVEARDVNPLTNVEQQLPYGQQRGSGTFDVMPGATFRAMNERGSFGLQVEGTLRLGENDRDYTFGNRLQLTTWGGIHFNDVVAGTIRLEYQSWDNVEGLDPELDFFADPSANPLLQGGSRWDLPVGVTFLFRDGPLAGHRLGTEFVLPIHHDLDGPQLGMDWGVNIRFDTAF